jgi:imidazoleglycerol-phosphate dehydratase
MNIGDSPAAFPQGDASVRQKARRRVAWSPHGRGLGSRPARRYKPRVSQQDFRMRKAEVSRTTAETALSVKLDLDGTGRHDNATGVGFFDHMLDQLARHALIDLETRATGDLHIDDHHTVEDVGIALGRALAQALGNKRGIRRYGACLLPMDETLVRAALDLSGRPFLVWKVAFPAAKIGSFDTELVREFFTALAMNGGITLNVALLDGANSHHIAEACFKAVAQALRAAVEPDPRGAGIPSTKGTLSG